MSEHLPTVVARIREARQRGDGLHVDTCWRRGVVGLEPGWFWAYEAGVSVGVPDAAMLAEPNMQELLTSCPGTSLLLLRRPDAVVAP